MSLYPRRFLEEPELCKILMPGVDKFFQSGAQMEEDILKFVSALVAKGADWRFQDALEYVGKHGVVETAEIHMQPVLKFLGVFRSTSHTFTIVMYHRKRTRRLFKQLLRPALPEQILLIVVTVMSSRVWCRVCRL